MSVGKRIIVPYPVIGSLPAGQLPTGLGGVSSGVSGDMSAASITSRSFNIKNMDTVGLQVTWPTTGQGSLILQASAYDGGYQTLPGFSVASPNGSNTGTLVDIVPTSMFWLRLVYTKVSGTGTMNAWFFGKAY